MTSNSRPWLIAVIAIAVAVLFLSGLVMMGGMMGRGWMGTDARWHPEMMWGVGGLAMLALWVLVIVGAVLVARWLGDDRRIEAAPPETPETILCRRYAAGELTREQFQQMKRDLEDSSA